MGLGTISSAWYRLLSSTRTAQAVYRNVVGSIIGRILVGVAQLVVFAILLSVLLSLALTLGVVDLPGDQPGIETPEPLPDFPVGPELPVTETGSDGVPDGEFGDPVETDPGTTHTGGDDSIASDEIEARIHERVNQIRADHGLPSVEHDDEVASIARTHSHDMGERGYFSHVNPEGEGPHDRFGDRFPRECRGVGENLAVVGTASTTDADDIAEKIVEGWMDSEGHRENILTEKWDSQGIGVYLADQRAFATQNFCDER